MLQIGMKFVCEVSSPHAFSTFASARWVTALQYEATHVPMKGGVVVVARCGQGQEVKGGFRNDVAVHSAKQREID
jgi:hypothetical protein